MTDSRNGGDVMPAHLKATALDDARHDIAREDRNVHNHLMVTLTVQGFMIASITLLLTGSTNTLPANLQLIRAFAPWVIGAVGFLVSMTGLASVLAARRSLRNAIRRWKSEKAGGESNRSDPYGGDFLHKMGGSSALTVASVLPVLWFAFMVTMAVA